MQWLPGTTLIHSMMHQLLELKLARGNLDLLLVDGAVVGHGDFELAFNVADRLVPDDEFVVASWQFADGELAFGISDRGVGMIQDQPPRDHPSMDIAAHADRQLFDHFELDPVRALAIIRGHCRVRFRISQRVCMRVVRYGIGR